MASARLLPASERLSLASLPNELLILILTPLRTTHLLPLCALSHRFHSLILRIITYRLSVAVSLRGQTLLLECYHPAARLTQPALTCTYLGTDGLDDVNSCEKDCEVSISPGEQLRGLRELFSRFRPHRNESQQKWTRRHPAGDIPGSRTFPASVQATSPTGGHVTAVSSTEHASSASAELQLRNDPHIIQPLVSHQVHLDSSELFSQLCARTIVAAPGSKPGIFLTPVDVSDGIIRVWRKWLAEQSDMRDFLTNGKDVEVEHTSDTFLEGLGSSKGKNNGRYKENHTRNKSKRGVLWVNDGLESVGVRFLVRQRKWQRDNPVLISVHEDIPVSYEIQYEELLVRTTHLLLRMEKSMFEQQNVSRRALVFGAFV